MSELGDLLKTRREELGKSFRAIYQDTKIREQHIRIIELGAFDELPSYLHAYGFVKKYAEYLGLDYPNVVKPLFDFEFPKNKRSVLQLNTQEESQPSENDNIKHYDKPISYSILPKSRNKLVLVGAIGVIAIALFFGYTFIFSTQDSIESTKPVPTTATVEVNTLYDEANKKESEQKILLIDNSTENENATVRGGGISLLPGNQSTAVTEERKQEVAKQQLEDSEATANKNIAQKEATPKRLLLTFNEDCWIQYTADSYPTVEYYGLAGQSKTVMFVDNFTLDVGNAGGLSFSYGRQKFSNFGTSGVVLKGLKYRIIDGILAREVN